MLEPAGLAEDVQAPLHGWPGRPDAITQIGDPGILGGIVLAQLPEDLLGFVQVEELVIRPTPQVKLHRRAGASLVDRVHGIGVQFLGVVENLRILSDGVMDFLNPVVQFWP